MGRTTARTREIRSFLLHNIPDHPKDIVTVAADRFGLSRQAIHRNVKELEKLGLITASGVTRQRRYELATTSEETIVAKIEGLKEDHLLRTEVDPLLPELSENVYNIWHYGFTEMVNNAIDHSGGTWVTVTVRLTAVSVDMSIFDDGVGIFRKIQKELGLDDERHAVLELAKGKLTTDPDHHTGEGIFFSSRMFDSYAILSGGVYFSHKATSESDIILELDQPDKGTYVYMSLLNDSQRRTTDVFDKYSTKDGNFGFSRTVVPVRLLKHGPELLVSRSQARRLLVRFDRFQVVILDFDGIEEIGQAFADEIFRVFARQHPEVRVVPTNMLPRVKRMVSRARGGAVK